MRENNNRVTVFLTSYNHEKFLRESIDSVLNQTYPNFELVIVDDASSDSSWEIIKSYSDPRISIFRSETPSSVAYATRIFAELSKKEFIAIHHSDDIWEVEKLEKQVAFLDANAQIGAVFTWAQIIDEDGQALKDKDHFYYTIFEQPNRSRHEWLNHFFYHGNALCHPSVLIHSRCYADVGPYRYGFAQLADFDMWVRLCLKYEIHVLPEKLVRFRVLSNEMNASGNRPEARIRWQFEFLQILNLYRNIKTPEELVRVFPATQKYIKPQGVDVGFALGMNVFDSETPNTAKLFGLNLLFEALNDPVRTKKINELYGFKYNDFVSLTAKHDIFATEEISKLTEQVLLKDVQIAEKDLQIIEKDAQILEKDAQIRSIFNSRTWKLASFFRKIRVLICPPHSLRETIAQKLSQIIFFIIRNGSKDNLSENISLVQSSDLFNETWYLNNNPDVADAKVDAVQHYLISGGFEGRDPGPNFSSRFYMATYADVKNTNINPLVHYLKFGATEGREIQPDEKGIKHNPTHHTDIQIDGTQSEKQSPTANKESPKVSVIIPTKNAGLMFSDTLEALTSQVYDGFIEYIVIDSGSTDDTISLANQFGVTVTSTPPEEFDHGLTRNRAIELASGEIIVLMSQDAIPGDQNLVRNFVTAFDDPMVAGAYARQIPREDADILTKRNLNNWITGGKTRSIRWIEDWTTYQNLTPMDRYYFCNFDDVCSAIRKSVWHSIPFKKNDFGEDIEWAQNVLEANWKIAYWPDAYVVHSHERSIKYEYDRSYLCHKKLYTQFGIHSVPTLEHVFTSTLTSIASDWNYVIQHENKFFSRLKLLAKVPQLCFAGVYGQYRGAQAGKNIKG